MAVSLTGGCACGRIRYRCDAEPIYQLICHCRDCQRASGSAFAEAILVPSDALVLSGDQPGRFKIMSDAGRPMQREFCRDCGSPLMITKPETPHLVFLQAASLDDPQVFKPELEIFTSKAHAWTQSGAAIPKKPEGPGAALIDAIQTYFRNRTA